MSILSPNMGLLISTVGVDSGLLWEQNLNASELILDGHNHTPGFGVQIPPAGLNINSSLSFQNQQAINLQAAVFTPQNSVATTFSAYFSGVDFYVTDGSGNVIQMTTGGSVNATTSGISSGSATASFVTSVLVVNQASATPANIQAGSILIGNNVASSNFATVQVPSSLAANYNFVLPPGTPAGASFLQMDASGNVTASPAVSLGITASNIANATITGAKLVNKTVTATQIADATITTTQVSATANITPAQLNSLSTPYYGEGTSSGAFGTSSGTPQAVTGSSNVQLSNVSSTRPVFITFLGGSVGIDDTGSATFAINCSNGLTSVNVATFTMLDGGSTGINVPCGTLNCIDIVRHGNQYTFTASYSGGGSGLTVTNVTMRLVQV